MSNRLEMSGSIVGFVTCWYPKMLKTSPEVGNKPTGVLIVRSPWKRISFVLMLTTGDGSNGRPRSNVSDLFKDKRLLIKLAR